MDKDNLPERKVLARVISYKNYVGLALGSMIGIGWVIAAGDLLTKGGPLGVILAFMFGGLLLITIGKCYAELTPALPLAGGELAFSYKAFGNFPSFVTTWFLAFAYIAICPFETVSIGWLFDYIAPELQSAPLYTVGGYPISLSSIIPGLSIGLIIIAINYFGIKFSAVFQTVSTALIFLCVIGFTVAAFTKGSFSNMQPFFARQGDWTAAPLSVFAVLGIVPFFMSGFDTIPQAAEESGLKVNPKDLGKAVIVSIFVGTIFYVIVIIDLSICLPWQEVVEFDMPIAEVFRRVFGHEWIARLVLFAAFLGLITSLNGFFIAATRIVFSAGRGGLLPKWFAEIDKKHHTPKNAIWFVGFLSLVGPFIGRSAILPIINVGSLAFVCAWFITCLAAIRLRKTAPDLKRPYKVKNISTLYIGAIISAGLVLLLIVPGSSAQLAWPLEYLILAAWLVLGFAFFFFRQKAKDMTKEQRDYQILGDYR
jgi:APA family basic amino acid/polyamine antiporter